MRDELVLAVHQPRVRTGDDAVGNVADAARAVRDAAEAGADLVLFPEGYPGPIRASDSYDAHETMAAAAAESGCAVCWSRVERSGDGIHHKVAYVHDRHGRELHRYVRSHPATGDVHRVLSGVALAPGSELALFELDGVPIGLLICSELWLPEIARVLAVRGAEVILAPAGGGFGRVAANWQLITRARAIENQCHVAMTQGLYDDVQGAALVAGPEDVVAASSAPGVLVAALDLARARWLRARDDSMENPKPFSSLPGLLRARRPEMYAELCHPVPGLYDYWAAALMETVR